MMCENADEMWCYCGTFGISGDIPCGGRKWNNFTVWSLCVCEPFVALGVLVTLRLAEALPQCLLMWVHTHFTHLSEWSAAVYPASPIFVHFLQVLGHSPSANQVALPLSLHSSFCFSRGLDVLSCNRLFFVCISPCFFFHVSLQLCFCSLVYLPGKLFYRGGTRQSPRTHVTIVKRKIGRNLGKGPNKISIHLCVKRVHPMLSAWFQD